MVSFLLTWINDNKNHFILEAEENKQKDLKI